ncbi:hypothetical protein [Kitasatospora indigofera]|uniref:hypothetical protein n=1 Tax=Kitasatospora indigofera TaxID=67307 RepID=UPI0036B3AAA5
MIKSESVVPAVGQGSRPSVILPTAAVAVCVSVMGTAGTLAVLQMPLQTIGGVLTLGGGVSVWLVRELASALTPKA